MLLHRGLQVLPVLHVDGVQDGAADAVGAVLAGITPQGRRDLRDVGEPGFDGDPGRGGVGVGAVVGVEDGDGVPLEALRLVHGEDLHAVGIHAHLAGFEPLLLFEGEGEVVEEAAQSRPGDLGEGGDVLVEAVEVHGSGDAVGVWVGPGEDLGADPGDPFDVSEDLGQVVPQGTGAQVTQVGGQPTEPGQALRTVALGFSQIGDGVGEPGGGGVVPGGQGFGDDVTEPGECRVVGDVLPRIRDAAPVVVTPAVGAAGRAAGEIRRAAREGEDVGGPQTDVGAGEDPECRPVVPGSDQHRRERHEIGDLGDVEEPTEPDDLDGDTAFPECGGDGGGVFPLAHEDGAGERLSPGATVRVVGGEPVREPADLGGGVGEPAQPEGPRG